MSNENRSKIRRNQRSNKKSKSNANPNPQRYASNDPNWYMLNEHLALGAGNIAFNNPAGIPINIGERDKRNFPGVMGIKYNLSVGVSSDYNSPINRAARLMYDRVNYKNARNRSYDPADLMITVTAIASAYTYHAFMQRLYGIMNVTSQTNFHIPDTIVSAMGVKVSDIRAHKDELFFYINHFALMVNKYACPSGMNIFERWTWLASNVFVDSSDLSKASMYVFSPQYLWEFDDDATTGSSCIPLELTPSLKSTVVTQQGGITFSGLKSVGDRIITSLQESQDLNFMSSDIMAAYENNRMLIASTPIDYTVAPVLRPELLLQVHNADVFTYSVSNGSFRLYHDPNTGVIKYEPHIAVSLSEQENALASWFQNPYHLLDAFSDTVAPGDVFEMTRFTIAADTSGALLACGSELLTELAFLDGNSAPIVCQSNYFDYDPHSDDFADDSNHMKTLEKINTICSYVSAADKFYAHPYMHMMLIKTVAGTGIYNHLFGDTNNFSNISFSDLGNVHLCALLSLFNVNFN